MAKARAQTRNKYWAVEPATTPQGATAGHLWLYGLITDRAWDESDVTPNGLVASLNALGDISELNVHVFSNGGDVFAGNAIYALLKQRKETVNVYVEGIAASIASVIAMAGDNVYIASNAMFMIHNPMVCLFGMFNKVDMSKMIADLDRVRDVTMQAYTDKTGISPDEIHAMLDANDGDGTWINADQAIKLGFADALTPSGKEPADMVAMVRPHVYTCRGHEIDLSMYKHVPELLLGREKNGGNKPVANARKPKAARRGKYRAELVSIECPHCNSVMNLDSATGIVSPDPAEDATVAIPTEETVAVRAGTSIRNEAWKITCPQCGGEFDYDTAPGGSVSTEEGGDGFVPDAPIPQARRKTAKRSVPVKATRKGRMRMEEGGDAAPEEEAAPEPIDVTCTECDTEFTVDVDPAIAEAIVVCPNCGAELTVDTSGVGSGSDGGGADPAPEPEAIVAYRNGLTNERRRVTLLNERKRAFPQYENAIDGFIRNGTSVDCANNWIFQALAANPALDTGNPAYRAAIRRDAQVLSKIGTPARGDDRANKVAANFASLAERRGTKKHA